MNDSFHKFVARVSSRVGSPAAFVLALTLIGAWLLTGIANGFTDLWLLAVNTICSVTTFLIVFLIQNTQNRQSRAMQLKLDELLKSVGRRKLRQEVTERHAKLTEAKNARRARQTARA